VYNLKKKTPANTLLRLQESLALDQSARFPISGKGKLHCPLFKYRYFQQGSIENISNQLEAKVNGAFRSTKIFIWLGVAKFASFGVFEGKNAHKWPMTRIDL
jgi:hypothetical protein